MHANTSTERPKTRMPTRNQFARFLSAKPPVHPAMDEYREIRRNSVNGDDRPGDWLMKKRPGVFNVLFAKCVNDPSTWEAVWEA